MSAVVLPTDMDRECIALCEAMNRLPGIETRNSCCGHNKYPYRIWFNARSLKALPRLLYWFDICHSGCPGWRVSVETDCAACPAFFVVEGPVGHYEDAEKIAKLLEEEP